MRDREPPPPDRHDDMMRESETPAPRFAFGRNWRRFSRGIDPGRIQRAEASLCRGLDVSSLEGLSFLDVGCGSGLFSLAACRLGARVTSFDVDEDSVSCAQQLRDTDAPGDARWTVVRGDVLDREFRETLERADVVYAWGVLHHTGDLWAALDAVRFLVADGGLLYLAIYNDQGRASGRWARVKSAYVRSPVLLRGLILALAAVRLRGPGLLRRPFGRSAPRLENRDRGMSSWTDLVDWVGGWPFEVARPEEIFGFYRRHGFVLRHLTTCAGGRGCNEFVFRAPSTTGRG